MARGLRSGAVGRNEAEHSNTGLPSKKSRTTPPMCKGVLA